MIDRGHDLPITKQAEVLRISRGSIYYLPRPVPEADLAIMRHLDRLHLEFPFAGSRMLRGLLVAEGCKIGRRHVKTLMQRMGIEALYRRPRTTEPEPGQEICPYLLRGLAITRPNQVWAMDITYIAMARGFVYLAVALDWFSRRVLAWRLRLRWRRRSASRRWRMPWRATASRRYQHRPGLAVHWPNLHRRARRQWHSHQHGRQRRLARQRVCRAALAQRQIRGGVSARLRQRQRSSCFDRPDLTSTMAAGPTRALTATHPIKPTSTRCPSAWQPNPGRDPLSDAENLFREPGPLHQAHPHTVFYGSKDGNYRLFIGA